MQRAPWIICVTMGLLVAGCDETATRPDQQVASLEKGVTEKGTVDGPVTRVDGKKSDGPAAACQPTTRKVEEFAPKPNAVAGWAEDLIAPGTAGLETGYTDGAIEGIIDGHQEAYKGKTDGFVREHYRKGNASLVLQLWDLKSAQDAKTLFDTKVKDDTSLAGITFTDIPNAPDHSVLGDNKPAWKVWGHKCDYHWEIYACGTLASSSTCDPATFDAVKPEVIAFVQYLTKQLP